MTSPVLFSTGASPASTVSRNLVEFKAGKLELRDKMVHPIKRKGLVYLRQSDDNLMHFFWKDRQTGEVEDDLILFPDDCEFKKVEQCTTGRVFVLKMKSANKKMFFWMQEPKSDRDDEYCKKINDLLNNPPRAGSEIGGSSSERDLHQLFGNMTQEQVGQFLTSGNLSYILNSAPGRSPSSNSGASGAYASNSAHNQSRRRDSSPTMNDLRALMMEGNEDEASALMASMAAAREGGRRQQGGSQQQQQQPLVDLSTAVNSDSLAELLEDQDFLKQLEPHLPLISSNQDQQQLSPEDLRRQVSETIRSSQFRSSLSQFCAALQSGQLGPLMSQFGLNQACVDAASLGNLEAFVKALESQHRTSSSTTTTTTTTTSSTSTAAPAAAKGENTSSSSENQSKQSDSSGEKKDKS